VAGPERSPRFDWQMRATKLRFLPPAFCTHGFLHPYPCTPAF
jgi:hypothetical protein